MAQVVAGQVRLLLVQIGREMFCIIIRLAICDGAEQSGRRCDDQIGKALIAGQFLREQPFEITAFRCAEPFLFVVRGIELDHPALPGIGCPKRLDDFQRRRHKIQAQSLGDQPVINLLTEKPFRKDQFVNACLAALCFLKKCGSVVFRQQCFGDQSQSGRFGQITIGAARSERGRFCLQSVIFGLGMSCEQV